MSRVANAVLGVVALAEFNTKKSVQAAAVILKEQPNQRMSFYHLLKLLYIADRESLGETRFPIIGDVACAMDKGPLHSTIYDFIKGLSGGKVTDHYWQKHVKREGNNLVLTSDPGEDELCPYEVHKLREICARPIGKNSRLASRESHGYAEFLLHHTPGTSSPIPLKDILSAVGRRTEADKLAKTIKGYAALEQQLRGAGE